MYGFFSVSVSDDFVKGERKKLSLLRRINLWYTVCEADSKVGSVSLRIYSKRGTNHKMKDYLRKIGWRRIVMMLMGNVFAGMGIAIFKLSGLGNDPYSGMTMALSACAGMAYANFQVLFNLALFAIQLIFGRKLIGIGTVINACLLGYIVTFFYNILLFIGTPQTMPQRLLVLFAGLVVCSFGLSLYQTANLGVSPYDSLALITKEKLPKIPYFWHRITDDAIAALVCYLAGGIVGIGTLVTAFGFGPVIHFFDRHFSEKLLQKQNK